MQTFQFHNTMSFEEYCGCIEAFILKDTKTKRNLGFLIQDVNNDNKLDLIDIQIGSSILAVKIKNLYNLFSDYDIFTRVLHKQISNIPEKQHGFYLKEFEEKFAN